MARGYVAAGIATLLYLAIALSISGLMSVAAWKWETRDMTIAALGEATPPPVDRTLASDRRQIVIWWIFVACVLALLF